MKPGDLVMSTCRSPIFTLSFEGRALDDPDAAVRSGIALTGDLMLVLGWARNHYIPIVHPIHGQLWIYEGDVEVHHETR